MHQREWPQVNAVEPPSNMNETFSNMFFELTYYILFAVYKPCYASHTDANSNIAFISLKKLTKLAILLMGFLINRGGGGQF